MNSGKSIQILSVAHNYEERGKSVLILKPSLDTIEGDYVHSRIGLSKQAHVVSPDDRLTGLGDGYDCVLVDESQFLSESQVDDLMSIVIAGTPVICYGLRSDFTTRFFPGSKRLMELAHTIEEIKTICVCGKKALFTARVNENGDVITEGSTIDIEDVEDPHYISLCNVCYNNKTHLWS